MSKRDAGEQPPDVDKFTEDLASILGAAQLQAATWLEQRKDIIAHLEAIRDTASALLVQLYGQIDAASNGFLAPAEEGGTRPPRDSLRKKPVKGSMSDEARRRI